MPSHRIQPLTPDRVLQAYALVRLVASHLPLEAWRTFACQRLAPSQRTFGGIHVVQDQLGSILGLASYTTDASLQDVHTLTVDNLVVVGTCDRQRESVLLTLLGAMESIAASHHCDAIQVRLEVSGSQVLDQNAHRLLLAAGHRLRYALFSKALETRD